MDPPAVVIDNLVNNIPTPSITANKTPPINTLPLIGGKPFLSAKMQQQFQGSYFLLT